MQIKILHILNKKLYVNIQEIDGMSNVEKKILSKRAEFSCFARKILPNINKSNFGRLQTVNLTNKTLKTIPLSDSCKQIILGSLLGDGSLKIHKDYKNARFKFRHSNVQKEYFFWKVHKLVEISSLKSVCIQKPDGFSKNAKLLYQSKTLPELTLLYNKTHKKNILIIKRNWLNHFSALSLAIWWLDDGSLISNKRKGVLCTDNFSKKSVLILSQYLQVVWNVKTRVGAISSEKRKLAKKKKVL